MSGTAMSQAPAAGREAGMRFIMLTVLIDMLAIGLIVPVLPALVGKFSTSPAEQTYWYGVVTFSFALASFFGAPILGALSDRFGRRPVLLLGFCGLAINFFVTAMASAIWMLIASRVVGGGMQANAAVANAYVADITPPEQRARRFGMLGAMFGIGFILGPVIGGLLGGIDLQLPFFVAGGLSLVNLAYGYFVLPESLPVERRRHLDWARANPFSSLKRLAELKGVGRLLGVVALAGLAQFTLYTTWVLYTTFKFHWGPTQNGWSLFAVGMVAATVQGALLGRLLKRFTPARLAVMGLVSSTLAFVGFGLVTQGWMMYVVVLANLLGNTVSAAMQSLISGAADGSSQGQTMGSVSSLNSLTAVIAPMFGAPLLGAVSHLPAGDWRIGAPMYFCAALQALALGLAITHFRKVRRTRLAPAIPAATP
ncbi:MAG: tetracycline transporter [Rubrivivax sp. SCN 70-15]|nr:MAG: tetracycline transporter [Rubrivivax sp. SCN 70-15]